MVAAGMDTASISGTPKALVKGAALVDLVAARAPAPVRQAELVAGSGLPRATAIRLLDALVELGLLADAPEGYRPGAHLAHWGHAFAASLDVGRLADDLLRELSAETRETCYLGVRDGDAVLYAAAALSPQPIRPIATVGARNPLHSTGIGRALLAFAEPEDREATVARIELPARTPRTLTDRAALRRELDRVARRGYAIDDIENEDGIRCVAAPVRDHRGRTVAAMSLSAPAYRFGRGDIERAAPRLIERAAELSRRLGHRPAADEPSPHGRRVS